MQGQKLEDYTPSRNLLHKVYLANNCTLYDSSKIMPVFERIFFLFSVEQSFFSKKNPLDKYTIKHDNSDVTNSGSHTHRFTREQLMEYLGIKHRIWTNPNIFLRETKRRHIYHLHALASFMIGSCI